MAGGSAFAADSLDRTVTASKLTISCFWPSSSTTKSSFERPPTGRPLESTATASTVTTSTSEEKVGVWARAAACHSTPPARASATPDEARAMVQASLREERDVRPLRLLECELHRGYRGRGTVPHRRVPQRLLRQAYKLVAVQQRDLVHGVVAVLKHAPAPNMRYRDPQARGDEARPMGVDDVAVDRFPPTAG